MENHLGFLDYLSVVATLVGTALIGVYFGGKNKTNDDLMLGGRKIHHWPVALSVMASYISAVTIIGFPAEVYGYGIEIFNMVIVGIIMFPISLAVFVPFLYPMKITSLFQYLELRFHDKSLRKLVCGIYIFEQLALTGVILYGPSLVLDTFLGIPTWMSIFGIGILCTLYTCVGGIRAVVWTDALQAIIMFLGMVAVMTKAFMNSGGISNSFSIAEESGRLNLFKMNFDIFQRHNFFNFYLGFAFSSFFRSSVHQQQLQRYSSQPTLRDAKKVMLLSIPATFAVKVVTVLTGIAVVGLYYNCDPLKLGKIKKMDHLIPYFVVTEMSSIPGVLGLFVACIFSGVLSSISSNLNSMTAVTWEDFLSDIPIFAKLGSMGQANVSRVTGLVYGLVIIILAFSAQYMGSVYTASYQVTGASTGVVAGVFLVGFFIRYVNSTGVKAGAIVSYIGIMTIGIRNIFSQMLKEPTLPTSIDGCTSEQVATFNSTSITPKSIYVPPEWPEKIFAISYLMYPLVGAIVTLLVSISVSYCTGGFQNAQLVPEEYLHPLVRSEIKQSANNGSLNQVKTIRETSA